MRSAHLGADQARQWHRVVRRVRMMVSQARKRVRAKPENRRAQILDEAIRLIGERGYNRFTIQELAQRCQLSNPGLLHYFGSKEDLLVALLEDRDRRAAEVVAGVAGLTNHSEGA